MTVKELISKLNQYDDHLPVFIFDEDKVADVSVNGDLWEGIQERVILE